VIITTVALGFEVSLKVQAMDRWAALSQIETRDDDNAIGTAGEISRYQIKPKLWRRYARSDANWKNPIEALATAQERSFNRAPTDFEFYILWNAPAQVERPRKVVRERAERFCRLVAIDDRRAKAD